jgi:hypothetical protein
MRDNRFDMDPGQAWPGAQRWKPRPEDWFVILGLALPVVRALFRKQEMKDLLLLNATDEPVLVHLQVKSQLLEGTWEWLPTDQAFFRFTLEAGETRILAYQGFRLAASRIKILARGTTFKDVTYGRQELWLLRDPYQSPFRRLYGYAIRRPGQPQPDLLQWATALLSARSLRLRDEEVTPRDAIDAPDT